MRRAASLLLLMAFIALPACHARKRGATPPIKVSGTAPVALTVTSSAIADDAPIPVKYTCDGESKSPPLAWSTPTRAVTSFELRVVDPDAGGFVHWVVTGIPASVRSVTEGQVPTGASVATPYRGPCPPKGSAPHHYLFNLIGRDGTTTVAIGLLTGTYQRAG